MAYHRRIMACTVTRMECLVLSAALSVPEPAPTVELSYVRHCRSSSIRHIQVRTVREISNLIPICLPTELLELCTRSFSSLKMLGMTTENFY